MYLSELPIYNCKYWVMEHGKYGLLIPCIYINYSWCNILHLEIITRHNSLPWGFIFVHYPWKLILCSKWGILCAWFSLDHTHFFMKDDSIILDDIHSLEQIKAAHPYKSLSPQFLFVGVYSTHFGGIMVTITNLGTRQTSSSSDDFSCEVRGKPLRLSFLIWK